MLHFAGFSANIATIASKKNGAFRGLNASECFDIIGEVTLGSIEEIAQVGTDLVFTAFKRAIFKI